MRDFENQTKELMEKYKAKMLAVAKVAITDLCDEVLQGAATPIDSGQFMANMRASIGAPDTTTSMDKDPDGVPTAMRIRQVVDGVTLGDTFYMSNSLPYGPKLEYGLYMHLSNYANKTPRTINGYSTQAPQGMFRVSIAKWKDIVFKAVEQGMNLTEVLTTDMPRFANVRNISTHGVTDHQYIAKYDHVYRPQIHANQARRWKEWGAKK